MMQDPLFERYSQLYPQSIWRHAWLILKTAAIKSLAVGLMVTIGSLFGMWRGYELLYDKYPLLGERIDALYAGQTPSQPLIVSLAVIWAAFFVISFVVYIYGMFGQWFHKDAVTTDRFVYDYIKSRQNIERRCYIFRILAWVYMPGIAVVAVVSGMLTSLLIGGILVLYFGIISFSLVLDFSKIEKAWRANNVPA